MSSLFSMQVMQKSVFKSHPGGSPAACLAINGQNKHHVQQPTPLLSMHYCRVTIHRFLSSARLQWMEFQECLSKLFQRTRAGPVPTLGIFLTRPENRATWRVGQRHHNKDRTVTGMGLIVIDSFHRGGHAFLT